MQLPADTLPSPKSIALVLAIPIPIFVGLNLTLGALLFLGVEDTTSIGRFLRFFDLNAEYTVPAWYSTILLAFAAVSSAVTAVIKRSQSEPFVRHWSALAVIFLYLSMDEALKIHERTGMPLREAFQFSGLLYFSWVVPAALILAALGAIYLRFILTIPRRLARHIVIAGVIYVGGALGLEMIGGLLWERHGPGVLTELTSMLEEVAEMIGIILYVYALADHWLHGTDPSEQPIGADLALGVQR